MHALDSWCERYRSETGARQSLDKNPLHALTIFRTLRSPLRSHALPQGVSKNTAQDSEHSVFTVVSVWSEINKQVTYYNDIITTYIHGIIHLIQFLVNRNT